MRDACQKGSLKEVELSLLNSNDLNEALGVASKNGHLNIVQFLVSKGASNCGYGIRQATENGHLDVIKYLFERNKRPASETYFHESCHYEQAFEVLLFWLRVSAWTQTCIETGFRIACINLNPKAAEILVSKVHNNNIFNTMLDLFEHDPYEQHGNAKSFYSYEKIIKILLPCWRQLHTNAYSLLDSACNYQNYALIKIALNSGTTPSTFESIAHHKICVFKLAEIGVALSLIQKIDAKVFQKIMLFRSVVSETLDLYLCKDVSFVISSYCIR